MNILPDKNARYRFKEDGSIWTIWEGEDFTDNDVTLYACETGEDGTWDLNTFSNFFETDD